MFSYEFYKTIHLVSLFCVFTLIGALLFGEKTKGKNILLGVTTVFILVSGMGLLARIGISHGEKFPMWVIGKFVVWILITALAPIWVKRLKSIPNIGALVFIGIALCGIYLVIHKPSGLEQLF